MGGSIDWTEKKACRGRKKSSRSSGCWQRRRGKGLAVSSAGCGRSWALKMVVDFRGTTGVSVDRGGDLSKWRRVATLAGCRVAVAGA